MLINRSYEGPVEMKFQISSRSLNCGSLHTAWHNEPETCQVIVYKVCRKLKKSQNASGHSKWSLHRISHRDKFAFIFLDYTAVVLHIHSTMSSYSYHHELSYSWIWCEENLQSSTWKITEKTFSHSPPFVTSSSEEAFLLSHLQEGRGWEGCTAQRTSSPGWGQSPGFRNGQVLSTGQPHQVLPTLIGTEQWKY